MRDKLKAAYSIITTSYVFKNSIWGLAATIFQSIFLSLFFIILTRQYSTNQFAQYLIATSIYQIVVSFSSMGLGQWFIREYKQQADKTIFLGKFLKIQLLLGGLFYGVNVVIALLLYPAGEIRLLIIILGINIIFDNLIYSFRNLNIAESTQSKSAIILLIDGLLKLSISCILFVYPLSILSLAALLLLVRLVTINSFIKKATTQNITIRQLLNYKVSLSDFKNQIFSNWHFVVIGSLSVVYWRISNIIISKYLAAQDVVNYEISFKVFSLFIIVPSVVSSSLFPLFVKYFNTRDFTKLRNYYQNAFSAYALFSLLVYAFVYSFAEDILPFAFGERYLQSILCVKLMFLSFLLFPTILLQANLIIVMKMEKSDMYFNLVSLIVHLIACFIGLYFYRSLDVINYSVLISFIAFHILQDALLIKKRMTSLSKCAMLYAGVTIFVLMYQYLASSFDRYFIFFVASLAISLGFLVLSPRYNDAN